MISERAGGENEPDVVVLIESPAENTLVHDDTVLDRVGEAATTHPLQINVRVTSEEPVMLIADRHLDLIDRPSSA